MHTHSALHTISSQKKQINKVAEEHVRTDRVAFFLSPSVSKDVLDLIGEEVKLHQPTVKATNSIITGIMSAVRDGDNIIISVQLEPRKLTECVYEFPEGFLEFMHGGYPLHISYSYNEFFRVMLDFKNQ